MSSYSFYVHFECTIRQSSDLFLPSTLSYQNSRISSFIIVFIFHVCIGFKPYYIHTISSYLPGSISHCMPVLMLLHGVAMEMMSWPCSIQKRPPNMPITSVLHIWLCMSITTKAALWISTENGSCRMQA